MDDVFHTLQHGPVGSIGDGKHMWGYLVSLDALVSLHDFFCVNRQFLVGVDNDAEESRISL